MTAIHYIVTAVIAFALSTSEILFVKYGLTFQLVLKRPLFLILYGLFYAAIAVMIDFLISVNQLTINSVNLAKSPLITCVVVGVTVKAFSRINIYTLKFENKKIDIGFKLLTNIFEDFFEKQISDDHDNLLITEISTAVKQSNKLTLNQMDQKLKQVLPSGFTKIKEDSYYKEISQFKDKFDKLKYFATRFGLKRLEQYKREI